MSEPVKCDYPACGRAQERCGVCDFQQPDKGGARPPLMICPVGGESHMHISPHHHGKFMTCGQCQRVLVPAAPSSTPKPSFSEAIEAGGKITGISVQSASRQTDKLVMLVRWLVGHPGECIGDHSDILAQAKLALTSTPAEALTTESLGTQADSAGAVPAPSALYDATKDLHDYLRTNVPDIIDISTHSELAGEGVKKRLQALHDALKVPPVAMPQDAGAAWDAALEVAAKEVESHWHHTETEVNQRDQAMRSAADIRKMRRHGGTHYRHEEKPTWMP